MTGPNECPSWIDVNGVQRSCYLAVGHPGRHRARWKHDDRYHDLWATWEPASFPDPTPGPYAADDLLAMSYFTPATDEEWKAAGAALHAMPFPTPDEEPKP